MFVTFNAVQRELHVCQRGGIEILLLSGFAEVIGPATKISAVLNVFRCLQDIPG